MKLIRYLFIGFLVVLPAAAESIDTPVSGPVLGYIGKSGALRPIIGVPGAAYFGPAVDLGDLELAAVSSGSGFAIALTSDRAGVRLLVPGSNQPSRILDDLNSAVDAVFLSPRGTSSALVHGAQIEILSNLPDNPVRMKTVEISSSNPTLVAVSDDGSSLAVVEAGVLNLFDAAGQKPLATVTAPSDLRFRSNSSDLIYTDGPSVMMASSGGVSVIAGAADGLSSPRAALFSPDGRLALIIDSSNNDLLLLRIDGGTSERIKLPCPSAGFALMNDSTIRFQCENKDQIHLLQLAQSGARVLFVPEPVE